MAQGTYNIFIVILKESVSYILYDFILTCSPINRDLLFLVTIHMNAFDRHKMNFTAWCEDCNDVFDEIWTANVHRDQNGHKINVTEFWITGRS